METNVRIVPVWPTAPHVYIVYGGNALWLDENGVILNAPLAFDGKPIWVDASIVEDWSGLSEGVTEILLSLLPMMESGVK
jgi:hypothetical protein